MKALNHILLLISLTGILLISLGGKSKYVNDLEIEVKELKKELSNCSEAYDEHIKIIVRLEDENLKWNNHVVRMQYTVGIKNPDTIFTYKEKLKHPINTRRTLKIK